MVPPKALTEKVRSLALLNNEPNDTRARISSAASTLLGLFGSAG